MNATSMKADQPHMQRALDLLRQARAEIQAASATKGGHRVTAVEHINRAIEQLEKGQWQPGYKAFGLAMGPKASGMVICKSTPATDAKLKQIEDDILSGKIKVSEG